MLFYFSTGFYDNWLLTWLASLPVCFYALQSRAGGAALAAFTAYVLGAMNQFGYLPPLLFVGTTMLSAAAFSTSILLLRSLTLANCQIFAPFAFAASWTSFEFVRSLISSFGTFDSLAYTQVYNLPIIQLASLTGIWGITFLLMLIPACLAVVWRYRQNRNICRLTILLSGSQWGLLTVSDSRGLLLGVTPTSTTAGEASLLSEVSLGSGRSLYSRTGDWMGWLCLPMTTWAVFRLKAKI